MAPPATAWQRLIFGLILAWWSCAAAALPPVPKAVDLSAGRSPVNAPTASAPTAGAPTPNATDKPGQPQNGASTTSKRLFVVLYSRADCPWCERARREHLNALAESARLAADGPVFVQIDIDSDAPLIDFSGRATTHRAFAQAQHATLTPTLQFLGADGRERAPAIVGYREAEFYGTLIDKAVASARAESTTP